MEAIKSSTKLTKVKDLIEALSKLDPEALIFTPGFDETNLDTEIDIYEAVVQLDAGSNNRVYPPHETLWDETFAPHMKKPEADPEKGIVKGFVINFKNGGA